MSLALSVSTEYKIQPNYRVQSPYTRTGIVDLPVLEYKYVCVQIFKRK